MQFYFASGKSSEYFFYYLGLDGKSVKVISEASFINRNGNRHLYATNKSIKGGLELETAFIAVINFGECAASVIAERSIFLLPTWSKTEENKA